MAAKIRYYTVDNGRAYWRPGRHARAMGFRTTPLGPDGSAAMTAAIRLNDELDRVRAGDAPSIGAPDEKWPPGSLGHFYLKLHELDAFAALAPRTREDYSRAWRHIAPRFGVFSVSQITPADSERFHLDIQESLSPSEAFRTLKIWRVLLNALVSYGVRATAPIGRVPNRAPKGRTQRWRHDEVMAMVAEAEARSLNGMALAIRLAWDTLLSPVDVRALTPAALRETRIGVAVEWRRAKTRAAAFAVLSADTVAALEAYGRDVLQVATLPIVRTPRGRPYKGKNYFAQHFREVRDAALPDEAAKPPKERRKLMDMRRAGSVEAFAGDASRELIEKVTGNTIADNAVLWETYVPATVEAAKAVAEARLIGRQRIAANG